MGNDESGSDAGGRPAGVAPVEASTRVGSGGHPPGGVIVVGIDESEAAAAAADWAADEAQRRHAVLRLVHGYVLPQNAGYPDYESLPNDMQFEIRQQSQRLLDRVGSALTAGRPDLSVDTLATYARAATAVRTASEHAILTVVGAGSAARIPGVPVGSVALAVASSNPVPVAVIHTGFAGQPSGPVVVGVDGSRLSDTAIGFAFDEASVRGAELVAVHAWSDFFLDGRLQSPLVDPKVLLQEERALLSECLAGCRERYPEVVVRHILVRKSPSAALLEYAAEAQVIVVGSHGRGGFTRMLLGSNSRALISHARCPVIVARHI